MSSLVSSKRILTKKLNLIKKNWGGGVGGKIVCQTVSNEVNTKCNYLHNVEHVVQSTF